MKKSFLTLSCLLLAALFWIPSASAAETSGSVQIENRIYADAALSCDVKLFGEQIKGSVFAVAFAESGQMKNVFVYSAAETVQVRLPDVTATDYVKILWLDAQSAPLARPATLRMSGNGALAYAKFSNDVLKLQERYNGATASDSDSDNPYASARLLVSCNSPLPALEGYDVVDMLIGPDNLYVLQFNSPEEAQKCAEYLATLPFVRYAEPDGAVWADA